MSNTTDMPDLKLIVSCCGFLILTLITRGLNVEDPQWLFGDKSAGKFSIGSLRTKNDAGLAAYNQGRYEEAEGYLLAALKDSTPFGIETQATAQTLINLGIVYQKEKKYVDAVRYFKRVLAICDRQPSTNGRLRALALNSLGVIYTAQNQYQTAESFFLRAKMAAELADNSDPTIMRSILSNLSIVRKLEGNDDGTNKSHLEEKHQDKFESLNRYPSLDSDFRISMHLAETAARNHDFAKAERLLKQAQVDSQSFGVQDERYEQSVIALAMVLERENKPDEAEALLRGTIASKGAVVGSNNLAMVDLLRAYSDLMRRTGQDAQAERIEAQANKIKRDPKREVTIANYEAWRKSMLKGSNLFQQHKYALAANVLAEAVKRGEQFGPDDVKLAHSLRSLGDVKLELGNYAEGESLIKRALTIQQKQFGFNNPKLLPFLHDLAAAYCLQKRYKEALPIYKRMIVIAQSAYGPNDQRVIIYKENCDAIQDGFPARVVF